MVENEKVQFSFCKRSTVLAKWKTSGQMNRNIQQFLAAVRAQEEVCLYYLTITLILRFLKNTAFSKYMEQSFISP